MTDNEIIKALECCNHNHVWQRECFDCEYATFEGQCGNELIKDALDLINRQNAEIERLQSMNQAKLDMIHDIRAELETAKSEAIKDFAEKLKTKIAELEVESPNEIYKFGMEDVLDYHMPKIINSLVKEMTEASNDKQKT